MALPRVWVHTQNRPDGPFESDGLREFARPPIVGEHFAFEPTAGWYRVTMVVHLLFPQADSDMKIYAIKIDEKEAINAAKRGS